MKKSAVVILIVVLAMAGALWWLWHQATRLPEWYTEGGSGGGITHGQGIDPIKRSLEQTIEDRLPQDPGAYGEVDVVLDEDDASKLIAVLISETAERHPFLRAVKASRTRIRDGQIHVEIVADLSRIPFDASDQGEEGPRVVETGLRGLLKGREVSLGAAGEYGLKDGRPQLDPAGKISIGGLSFSQETVFERLGISKDKLAKGVGNLALGNLKIDSIEPGQNNLQLRGGVSRP
jgi:hypothetical protein